MNQWRELKRWQRWLIIGFGAFIALAIIGTLTAPEEDQSLETSASQTTQGTAPSDTTAPSAPATTAPTTTRATAAAPTTTAGASYAGRQRDDRLAPTNGSIELSGYTTTVSDVDKSSDTLSRKLICATVSIRNRDSRAQRYSQFDFRLQTPGGEVKNSTLVIENGLDSGDLIAGGSKTGRVCWEDPEQAGQYVVIWKPDAFNADRGIWLVTL